MKILLGETRREAINRVQERLGPATSRPLAEQTFWACAKNGTITMDPLDGTYLIEATVMEEVGLDVENSNVVWNTLDNEIRGVATKISRGCQYSVTRNHFHRARVAWNWKAAQQASIFSPTLEQCEGYDPDAPTDGNCD